MDYKYSSERKSHTSLTLNKKLKTIKLSEEGMLKDKTETVFLHKLFISPLALTPLALEQKRTSLYV